MQMRLQRHYFKWNTPYFREVVGFIKGFFLLTSIVRPWPPRDFGMLVDSQTFSTLIGAELDSFSLYYKAIFGEDFIDNSSTSSPVLVLLLTVSKVFDDARKVKRLKESTSSGSACLQKDNQYY